jgi:hypothetical protein
MSNERIKVLNMLNAGTINVEQANQLLDALEGKDVASGRDLLTQAKATTERSASPNEPRFGEFTFDQVVHMEREGVEPSFFAKVRQMSLTDLSFEQVLRMASEGVEPEFVLQARELGIPDLTFEQTMQMADAGVDSDFLVQVREAELTDLSFDRIVQMVESGVEPEVFGRLRRGSVKH